MNEESKGWDKQYRQVDSLWKHSPNHTLVNYVSLIPKGKVFDLGLGEGRNSLFFAEQGFTVHGLDISDTAVSRVIERAASAGLSLTAEVGDIRDITIEPGRYSLIIADMSLHYFVMTEFREIVAGCIEGLKESGFFYLSVFSTADPAVERHRLSSRELETNTYESKNLGCPVHFFTRTEIEECCGSLNPIHFFEGVSLDISHGEPHYHGTITFMGQKC